VVFKDDLTVAGAGTADGAPADVATGAVASNSISASEGSGGGDWGAAVGDGGRGEVSVASTGRG
jgi:hypothetical protein